MKPKALDDEPEKQMDFENIRVDYCKGTKLLLFILFVFASLSIAGLASYNSASVETTLD